MSLTDATRKMSKFDTSDFSRINILDSPGIIQHKIKKCKTDQERGLNFDDVNRPECHNLLSLYEILSGQTRESVVTECRDMSWDRFKRLLTEATIAHLEPIQTKYQEIVADQTFLEAVLSNGRRQAEVVANKTLDDVKTALGFLMPF
jgi:tryptophanyl-tRNA synthetase